MANQQKQTLLDEFTKELNESRNFALVKFEKTTHSTLESLRRQLRENDAQLKILKNSVFEKAVNKLSADNKKMLEFRKKMFPLKENSALLSLKGDWDKGLKSFYNFIQKEKTISFKIGMLDQAIYSSDQLEKIAKLPPKAELMAKVIGGMKSPLFSLNYSLKFHLQKFVYILSEKSKQTS